MLRAIFTVPWSLTLLHLFFTNRGRRLGASSRFKTWPLVFWCLLRHSRLFNDRPRQISITIVDLVLTPWLHIIFAHVWNDHFKSIHSFKLGSAKSMFALFYFYFFTFPMIFPLRIQCVCVCAYLLCSNWIYYLCAHASCNFLYGHAIQSDIKVHCTRSRKVRMHRLNEFSPVIAYLWHQWGIKPAVISKYRMARNRNSVKKTFKL